MPFFTYYQNNSNGMLLPTMARYVIVEADSPTEGDEVAQQHGVYFGYAEGDCACCGKRWENQHPEAEGDPVPSIYGDPVPDDEGEDEFGWPYKVIRKVADNPFDNPQVVMDSLQIALDAINVAVTACADYGLSYRLEDAEGIVEGVLYNVRLQQERQVTLTVGQATYLHDLLVDAANRQPDATPAQVELATILRQVID